MKENQFKGVLLMVLGMAVLNAMDAVSKYLTIDHSAVQVTWARYFFFLLPLVLVMGPSRVRRLFHTVKPWAQVARSTSYAVSALCIIIAFGLMPLADAIAVSFVSPLIIVALSAYFLRERVGLHRWVAVAVGFVGVLVLVSPSGAVVEPGTFFAIAAAVFWAIGMILTRHVRHDDPWSTLFYTALIGTGLLSLGVAFFWSAPSMTGWGLMLVMGLLGGVAHTLMILAFRNATASLLAPFNYTLLVWATLYGWLLFGDLPGARTILGTAVIVAAGLYAWHRERLAEQVT